MEINKASEDDRKYKWNRYPPPRKDRIKVIIVDKTYTRTHTHTHTYIHTRFITYFLVLDILTYTT